MVMTWGDGPDTFVAASGRGTINLLVALAYSTSLGPPVIDPSSVGSWRTLVAPFRGTDQGQFPGPGSTGWLGWWGRTIVPGETGANAIVVKDGGAPTNGTGAYVWELANVDSGWLGLLRTFATTVNLAPMLAGAFTVGPVSPPTAGSGILLAAAAVQKVNYGQVTQASQGVGVTGLATPWMTNVAGADLNAGTCGVTADAAIPDVWLGYVSGTGILSAGGAITCTGAVPDYNMSDLTLAGIRLPLTGPATITQSARGTTLVPGATFAVNLPGAP